jgi:hypothetical protein
MQTMQCPMCGLQYSSLPEDLKTHQEFHKNAAISYDKTIERYKGFSGPVRWRGRPEKEDIGTYLALNVLNLRMVGFESIIGLDEADLMAFQNGDGEVIPIIVSGDGHDRAGLWLTLDGRVFKYTANWRSGMADFSKYAPKPII